MLQNCRRFLHTLHEHAASEEGSASGEFGIVLGFFAMFSIPLIAVFVLHANGGLEEFFSVLG